MYFSHIQFRISLGTSSSFELGLQITNYKLLGKNLIRHCLSIYKIMCTLKFGMFVVLSVLMND